MHCGDDGHQERRRMCSKVKKCDGYETERRTCNRFKCKGDFIRMK